MVKREKCERDVSKKKQSNPNQAFILQNYVSHMAMLAYIGLPQRPLAILKDSEER